MNQYKVVILVVILGLIGIVFAGHQMANAGKISSFEATLSDGDKIEVYSSVKPLHDAKFLVIFNLPGEKELRTAWYDGELAPGYYIWYCGPGKKFAFIKTPQPSL